MKGTFFLLYSNRRMRWLQLSGSVILCTTSIVWRTLEPKNGKQESDPGHIAGTSASVFAEAGVKQVC